jgi:competence protein ComEA
MDIKFKGTNTEKEFRMKIFDAIKRRPLILTFMALLLLLGQGVSDFAFAEQIDQDQELAGLVESVNINTADAALLAAVLKGVGQKKAQAIIEFREANGPFVSADDLARVKGIGPRTVEINRSAIRI